MPFQVFTLSYGQQEPVARSGFISGKQAVRLMGSLIRGKRFEPGICRIYAVGKRFGWIYSQRELRDQLGMNEASRQRANQNLSSAAI